MATSDHEAHILSPEDILNQQRTAQMILNREQRIKNNQEEEFENRNKERTIAQKNDIKWLKLYQIQRERERYLKEGPDIFHYRLSFDPHRKEFVKLHELSITNPIY